MGAQDAPVPAGIGRYPVERELGRGGMGVVYLAMDPRLERRIAIKMVPDHISADAVALEQLQNEARSLAALNHPNVATVHSLEEDEGHLFFTLEYIEGEPLDTVIEGGGLGIDESLTVAQQMARALEAAHRAGVIHRDLKPENVMLGEEHLIKVLDFGLAEHVSPRDGESTVTFDESTSELLFSGSDTTLTGTPGYMSPEQLDGAAVDARSDIWAFGVLFFECLTGRRLFLADSLRDTLLNTLAEPIPWDRLPGETPPRVREILASCLRRSLDKRLADVATARRAIEEEIAFRTLPRDVRIEGFESLHHLPRPVTSFVAREAEISEIVSLLRTSPIVTLSGIGGSGKTRLAIAATRRAAAEFTHGVWWIDLSPLGGPDEVVSSVVAGLELPEDSSRGLQGQIEHFLRSRRALVVLDNCETVLDGAAQLAAGLAAACPDLRILATSREAFGVPGESVLPIPPLETPTRRQSLPLKELGKLGSVQLFVERARAVQPSFELNAENALAVSRICRRLDGSPLALELAAARVKMLPVEEIAKRLADRFLLLATGDNTVLPRHQKLRATIDWSYEQLSDSEQLLFRRLSVFFGGWTLEAAESTCAADGIEDWEILDLLAPIVDRCLVQLDAEAASTSGRARYRMLETVREYSRDRLEEDEGHARGMRARHRDYCIELARSAEKRYRTRDASKVYATLDFEHDNLQGALQSGLAEDGSACRRLTSHLVYYWFTRGYWTEGRRTLDRVLSLPENVASIERVHELNWSGQFAHHQGDLVEARRRFEEALDLSRKLENDAQVARGLSYLALVLNELGERDRAQELLEEALAGHERLGNEAGAAHVANRLGNLAFARGDARLAIELYDRSLVTARQLEGPDLCIAALQGKANALWWLSGEFDAAQGLYTEALALGHGSGNRRAMRPVLVNLGRVEMEKENFTSARAYLEQALGLEREFDDVPGIIRCLCLMTRVGLSNGDYEEARRGLAEAVSISGSIQATSWVAPFLECGALFAASLERFPEAARLFHAAEQVRERLQRNFGGRKFRDHERAWSRVSTALGAEELSRIADDGLDPESARRIIVGMMDDLQED